MSAELELDMERAHPTNGAWKIVNNRKTATVSTVRETTLGVVGQVAQEHAQVVEIAAPGTATQGVLAIQNAVDQMYKQKPAIVALVQ